MSVLKHMVVENNSDLLILLFLRPVSYQEGLAWKASPFIRRKKLEVRGFKRVVVGNDQNTLTESLGILEAKNILIIKSGVFLGMAVKKSTQAHRARTE